MRATPGGLEPCAEDWNELEVFVPEAHICVVEMPICVGFGGLRCKECKSTPFF